ncbi:phosphoadenylyl-sulfate reductase [Dasania marina]|uniref:phosphoadenylyl-sulfate reductase n=1 Tax=Dasania marina TaxID=471499 RepID=UPI00037A65D1|nr:phosphoadenylyl-sulfate reductase [Dasania marina]
MTLADKVNTLIADLQAMAQAHKGIVLANSLGAEDMLLTHVILRNKIAIDIFSLDTGRLHPETVNLLSTIESRYDYRVHVYYPQAEATQNYVAENGINGFYNSLESRKSCCYIRKVEPLKRALSGKEAWITGMRSEQSLSRAGIDAKEWDEGNDLWKYNPLASWTEAELWQYLHAEHVPYNPLHDQGFPSIGCAPCTRAVQPGEDVRAGRWWWEQREGGQECGLHVAEAPVTILK